MIRWLDFNEATGLTPSGAILPTTWRYILATLTGCHATPSPPAKRR
ncbi:hypothetical protein KCP76_15580 [Salmonella enterica subsp. enterica serovar Weltevreden]|nr:hypothetical protein KCP76_15580 [Salmonella enterica subsp. enterica serovar Weltevreden]